MFTAGAVAILAPDIAEALELIRQGIPVAVGLNGREHPTGLLHNVIEPIINRIGISIVPLSVAGQAGLAVMAELAIDALLEDLGMSGLLPGIELILRDVAAAMAKFAGISAQILGGSDVEGEVSGSFLGRGNRDGDRELAGQIGAQEHATHYLISGAITRLINRHIGAERTGLEHGQ